MDIQTRRLDQRDAGLLNAVADEVFDEAVDPDLLARYLADCAHVMIVALSEGIVIGQIAAVIHRHPDRQPDLYIDNLAVTPKYRRRGIARRLLAEIMAAGADAGCQQSWIVTETDNEEARGLYEGRGAAPVCVVMYEYDLHR